MLHMANVSPEPCEAGILGHIAPAWRVETGQDPVAGTEQDAEERKSTRVHPSSVPTSSATLGELTLDCSVSSRVQFLQNTDLP